MIDPKWTVEKLVDINISLSLKLGASEARIEKVREWAMAWPRDFRTGEDANHPHYVEAQQEVAALLDTPTQEEGPE